MKASSENGTMTTTTTTKEATNVGYQGQFCSNLGWILDATAAKHLWSTSLRTPYMMKLTPPYLNGYLAFKSRLEVVDAFKAFDYANPKQNCLEMFAAKPEYLLCPENFTISSRYTRYIAAWNVDQKFIMN